MNDVAAKVFEYENSGFTRDQAIELVKIERLIAINNRLKELNECIQNQNERT